MYKGIWKYIINSILLAIIIFGVIVLFSFLPVTGSYKLVTVLSGSMEPTFSTGSLIFVRSDAKYNVGDVITRTIRGEDFTITHRIVKRFEDGNLYITQGDANNSPDKDRFGKDQIIGKVYLDIPYLGYAVNFARTRQGVLLFVIIPAAIILYEESHKVHKELRKLSIRKTYGN